MLDWTSPTGLARVALERAHVELTDEIRNYPGPVAGCDAQYNHLLAERLRVQAALRALDEVIHIPTPRAP